MNNYDSKKALEVAEYVLNEIMSGKDDYAEVFKGVVTDAYTDFTVTIAAASAVCLRDPHADLERCAMTLLEGIRKIDELHEIVDEIADEVSLFAIEKATDALEEYLND